MDYNPNFSKRLTQEEKRKVYKFMGISRLNSLRRKRNGGIDKEKRLLPLLVKEFKNCFWCGVEVVDTKLDGGKQPHYAATVDHLKSRFFRKLGEDVLKVLSCYRCNAKRCDIENKLYTKIHIEKLSTDKKQSSLVR